MRPALILIFILLGTACDTTRDSAHAPPVDTESYRGRWLLINYWAVWCKPCREEIPDLNHLARYKPQQIAVLGVNYDGLQGDELSQAIELMGIEFTAVGEDPATAFGVQRPIVLPTSYLIDPQGRILHELQGPQHYQHLVDLIDAATADLASP